MDQNELQITFLAALRELLEHYNIPEESDQSSESSFYEPKIIKREPSMPHDLYPVTTGQTRTATPLQVRNDTS